MQIEDGSSILDFRATKLWWLVQRFHNSMLWQHLNQRGEDFSRYLHLESSIRGMRKRFDPYPHAKQLRLSQRVDTEPPYTNLQEYQYDKLPSDEHIRLVHLLPGPPDSDIRIQFSVVALSASSCFETLSYVWGEKQYRRIICDGRSLIVRQSLFDALNALRLQKAARAVWIDALSINQGDLMERGKQVRIMSTIFGASWKTIVWLGHPNAYSQEGVALLHQLADWYRTSKINKQLPADELVWRELGDLFGRPWFYRVWIVQEVVAAQDILVQFGTLTVPWQVLVEASQCAWERCQTWQIAFDPSTVIRLDGIRSTYRTHGAMSNIFHALSWVKQSLATLDVDQIYAVLGLTSEDFKIDYQESAPETYLRLAATVTTGRNKLDLLNRVDDHTFRKKHFLPTWVPDWEVRQGPQPLCGGNSFVDWDPSCGQPPYAYLSTCGRQLHVRGFVLDRLCRLGDTFMERVPVAGAPKSTYKGNVPQRTAWLRRTLWQIYTLRRVQQWNCLAMKYGTMFEDLSAREDAFLLTITGVSFKLHSEALTMVRKSYTLWCRIWLDVSQNTMSAAVQAYSRYTNAELSLATSFMQDHVNRAWGRRLFTTRRLGVMGLCPRMSRANDLLVVLYGGRTPYVIRRTRSGRYKFIGECYAHDFMCGEAARTNKAKNIEDFVLI